MYAERMVHVHVATLAAAFLCCSVSAHAQTTGKTLDAEMAAKKQEAASAFADEQYARALDIHRRIYDVTHDPAQRYNIARCLQYLGKPIEALTEFEAFEREAPAELKAKVAALPELMRELAKSVSTLEVQTNVEGAAVRLRGESIGTTPLRPTMRFAAGPAVIEVEKSGYRLERREILLPGGSGARLEVSLTSLSITGKLRVRTNVHTANIWVDEAKAGTGSYEAMLPAGTHHVRVLHDNYKAYDTNVELAAGSERLLDAALEREASIVGTWWFWTGVGVLVVAGGVTIYALSTEQSPSTGSLGPGKLSGVWTF